MRRTPSQFAPRRRLSVLIETRDDGQTIALTTGETVIATRTFRSPHHTAERLLPTLSKLCTRSHIALADIREIALTIRGGTFTASRMAFVTANLLAWTLDVPVSTMRDTGTQVRSGYRPVAPIYTAEPTMTTPRP